MDKKTRHRWVWKAAYPPVHFFCTRLRCFSYEPVREPGPYLLISNHATNFLDILFIAMAVGKEPVSYVGSEHLMRAGTAGRLLAWGFDLIPRPKGATGLSSVRDIIKALRGGNSVVLFAEGNASWDGRTAPVVKGTGSLVRAAGVPLVTYRLEGGYLTRPRWSRGPRRGPVHGRVVNVYPPETLRSMTSDEVNDLIDADIHEDVWERQKKEMIPRKGKHLAEYLERLLYMCPRCRRIGTLVSRGDGLTCACGAKWRYLDTGFLEPADPFMDLAQWEDWQAERLKNGDHERDPNGEELFSDGDCTLSRIGDGHRETALGTGRLIQTEDAVACAGHSFALGDIREMDMARHNILLFTTEDGYWQVRAEGRTNLRKYLEVWKQFQER